MAVKTACVFVLLVADAAEGVEIVCFQTIRERELEQELTQSTQELEQLRKERSKIQEQLKVSECENSKEKIKSEQLTQQLG